MPWQHDLRSATAQVKASHVLRTTLKDRSGNYGFGRQGDETVSMFLEQALQATG